MAQHFKDLVAWQKAMDLVEAVYVSTERFPQKETYGLTSQIRRAAVSVPSNIAEGQAKFSKREFRHYLRSAKGSLAELETQIIIATRLNYLTQNTSEQLTSLIRELGRVLAGLISSLRVEDAD